MRAGRGPWGRGFLGSSSGVRQPAQPVLARGTNPAGVRHRVKFKQKEEEEEEGKEEENPLLVPLEEKSVLEEQQTSLWFGKVSPAGTGRTAWPWPQRTPGHAVP